MLLVVYPIEIQIFGLLTLIAVMVCIFFASIVILKAIHTKGWILYLFGVGILFILSPWYPTSIGYLFNVITQGGEILWQLQVFLGAAFLPIGILAWIEIYRKTAKENAGKILLYSYLIIAVITEIYLVYFLFITPGAPIMEYVVYAPGPNGFELHYNFNGWILAYIFISLGTFCVTGIHFAWTSRGSEMPIEIQWKGRFLLLGFSFAVILVLLEATGVYNNVFLMVMNRSVLILTVFFFYVGFIMPKWVKKILKL